MHRLGCSRVFALCFTLSWSLRLSVWLPICVCGRLLFAPQRCAKRPDGSGRQRSSWIASDVPGFPRLPNQRVSPSVQAKRRLPTPRAPAKPESSAGDRQSETGDEAFCTPVHHLPQPTYVTNGASAAALKTSNYHPCSGAVFRAVSGAPRAR